MTNRLGSGSRPLRIVIVGAGPSGFYAAGALLQQKEHQVSIDILDRLPTPYGLVRYGVAPDHQKIKTVTKLYDRTIADPRVRYFGNVNLGTDVTHDDLRTHYDQVVYAVGAQSDRKLRIPGEDLEGSFSATEFVAWYNGHPDSADQIFDLSQENVAVIGVGNVAMDVARILAKSPKELATTDIADRALDALRESNVRNIYIIARRGPVQAKFTNPEIRELGELEIAEVVMDPEDLALDPYSQKTLENDSAAVKNMDILRELAEREPAGKPRRIHFRFLASPVEIEGHDGRVTAIKLERNELRPTDTGYLQSYGTGEYETLPVGLVFRSIGYRGIPIPDVPFHARWGIISNENGRVTEVESGATVRGEYVVGWAKRGPTGVIGTNKPDAAETVNLMLEDVPLLTPVSDDKAAFDAFPRLLKARKIPYVTFQDWKLLDGIEVERGKAAGRPRIKFTSVEEMLAAIQAAKESTKLVQATTS